MADLGNVALSVASTLTLQGAYFVFFKYPKKVSKEKLALEMRQQEMVAQIADQADIYELSDRALVELRAFDDGLYKGTSAKDAAEMLISLQMTLAQLKGLEVFDQPLASHVQKMCLTVSHAVEMSKGWQGAPRYDATNEFSLLLQTLLYSTKAVKRADEKNLTAFWMQMRQRVISLRALVQMFLASGIALELAAVSLLGFGFHGLVVHGFLPRWAGWTVWVLMSYMAHRGIHRVLAVIWPVNELVASIERQSAVNLKGVSALDNYKPTAPVETPMKENQAGETKGA